MFFRVVSSLLGLWLFVAAFLFHRVPAQFWNVMIVGILVMGFGVAAILGRHDFRKVNFVLGLWLFISALALPHASGGPLVHQLVVSVLLVIASLFPEHLRYRRPYTAT
jgi:hypothetical protein